MHNFSMSANFNFNCTNEKNLCGSSFLRSKPGKKKKAETSINTINKAFLIQKLVYI